jgi:hypothetical protein
VLRCWLSFKKIHMTEIILTRNLVAVVDDQDADLVNRYKWHTVKGKNTFYAGSNDYSGDKKVDVRMHWLIIGKPDRGSVVDHIDGNGLNNLRNNLRICSYGQNGANRKAWGASKFLGVALLKGRSKPCWEARITGKYL